MANFTHQADSQFRVIFNIHLTRRSCLAVKVPLASYPSENISNLNYSQEIREFSFSDSIGSKLKSFENLLIVNQQQAISLRMFEQGL